MATRGRGSGRGRGTAQKDLAEPQAGRMQTRRCTRAEAQREIVHAGDTEGLEEDDVYG